MENILNGVKNLNIHSEYNIDDINIFYIIGEKQNNGKDNKKREQIIADIINGEIPSEFFNDDRWRNLQEEIYNFLIKLNNNNKITQKKCIIKGGRKYNYDFDITINNEKFKIEFKYNANSIFKLPQILDLHCSNYLSNSFEEYYYDNYVSKNKLYIDVIDKIPPKNIYLNEIKRTKPPCMKLINEKVNMEEKKMKQKKIEQQNNKVTIDAKNEYREELNNLSKKAIKEFIKTTDPKTNSIIEKIKNSNDNKIYMLYFNKKIYVEQIDNIFEPTGEIVKTKNSYEIILKNGNYINCLLRWKNRNGIANPAISVSIKKKN